MSSPKTIGPDPVALQLCAELGLDPDQVTEISAESATDADGNHQVMVRWSGAAVVDPEVLERALAAGPNRGTVQFSVGP